MHKSVHHLVIQDFRDNPVWQPIDDFQDPEMLIEPFLGTVLNLEEIYLVSIKATLADTSEYEGFVRFSSGKLIVVELSISDDEFIIFPVERLAGTENERLEFLKKLGKNEDNVFPFSYQLSVDIRFEGNVY